MTEILLPQLGETVTEGTITRWFKQPGEAVALDEPLYEVSTDKVDTEVSASVAGVVLEILVPEGETVEVGTVLAQMQASDAAESSVPHSVKPEISEAFIDTTSAYSPKPEAVQSEVAQSEVAQPDTGQSEAVQPETTQSETTESETTKSGIGQSDVAEADPVNQRMSPVVRRLLHKNNIDPASITGSGPKGRITRKDAEVAVKKAGTAAPKKTATVSFTGRASPATSDVSDSEKSSSPTVSSPTENSSSASSSASSSSGTETIALSHIRKATAEHMVRSKATSPHVLTAVEVDFEEVEKARRAHKDEWKAEEGFSLTYLPFIARAVCDALDEYPHINATVTDEELVVHHSVNLAVAVDLDFQGLIAPVVHGAENLRLRAIARQVVDLAKRARGKQLRPEEVAGGTFTITNPGQWGTMMQFPIINQPQVAILSTDGIKRKPVVVADGYGGESIAIHSVGVLALAWDHRAFDGAYVAAFLDELRRIIETRDWEAELA